MDDTKEDLHIALTGGWGVVPAWAFMLLAFAIGVWLTYERFQYVMKGVRCEGVVVDVNEHSQVYRRHDRFEERLVYDHIVAYSYGNRGYRFKADLNDSYDVGDTVPVLTLPDQPDQAIVGTFWAIWLAPIICFGLVLVPFVVALVVWAVKKCIPKGDPYKQAQYLWDVHREAT